MAWAMFLILNFILGLCYLGYSRILEENREGIIGRALVLSAWVVIIVFYSKTFLL